MQPYLPLVAFCLPLVLPAQARWQPVQSAWPAGPMRLMHAMTADPDGGVLLFGGYPSIGNYTPSNQLWRWHNQTWTQVTSAHVPPGQRGPMLVTDTLHNRVIMHGGYLTTETWEWNGVDWRQIGNSANTGLAGQISTGYCFDRARDRLVVYGGTLGGGIWSSDTYEFDGATWVLRQANFPPSQEMPAMAFDTRRNRSVMIANGVGQTNTWEWDGNGWAIVGTLPVLAPYGGLAVWDEARGRTVFLTNGGTTAPGIPMLTWEWDGSVWVQRAANTDLQRSSAAMAADPASGSIWLYGGAEIVNWTSITAMREYRSDQPATWSAFGAGCGSVVPTLAIRDWPWLGDTMRVRITAAPQSFGILNSGFSNTSYQNTPLPFDLGAIGLPGCTAYVGPEAATTLSLSSGEATFALSIPMDGSLLGLRFFQQLLSVQNGQFAASAGAEAHTGLR